MQQPPLTGTAEQLLPSLRRFLRLVVAEQRYVVLTKIRIFCIMQNTRNMPGRMSMITVTSAEFQRNFGLYQDKALTEPVAVTRNGRERIVVISAEEYRRLRHRAREVLQAGALSDADLDAIAKTEMDPRHQHLDLELK
jgi:prevent-host-death family protein